LANELPQKARIPELDGLRGLAILPVLMFHLGPNPTRIPLFAAYITQSGWLGVDLFFVLSGYLITGLLLDSAGRPGYYSNFITRRMLRIFPLYYAVLLIGWTVDFSGTPIRWHDFAANGGWWYPVFLGNIPVFLQNKWPTGIMTPLWSLQVEEQFYVTFPLLVAVLPRRALKWFLVASVVAAPLLRVAMIYRMPNNIAGTYVLMPCRMDALAMGGLIAIGVRDFPEALRARWIGWATALSTGALVWIIWSVGPTPWSARMRTAGFSLADLAFTGTLVLLMCQRQRWLLAICRIRPLVWIGTVSYGLYLLHSPVKELVHWFGPALRISADGFAEMFLAVAVSMAAAWASSVFFELPILRLRERLSISGLTSTRGSSRSADL
jgi:peptidoglycan/LPS O-acetylase OafA/YrhL